MKNMNEKNVVPIHPLDNESKQEFLKKITKLKHIKTKNFRYVEESKGQFREWVYNLINRGMPLMQKFHNFENKNKNIELDIETLENDIEQYHILKQKDLNNSISNKKDRQRKLQDIRERQHQMKLELNKNLEIIKEQEYELYAKEKKIKTVHNPDRIVKISPNFVKTIYNRQSVVCCRWNGDATTDNEILLRHIKSCNFNYQDTDKNFYTLWFRKSLKSKSVPKNSIYQGSTGRRVYHYAETNNIGNTVDRKVIVEFNTTKNYKKEDIEYETNRSKTKVEFKSHNVCIVNAPRFSDVGVNFYLKLKYRETAEGLWYDQYILAIQQLKYDIIQSKNKNEDLIQKIKDEDGNYHVIKQADEIAIKARYNELIEKREKEIEIKNKELDEILNTNSGIIIEFSELSEQVDILNKIRPIYSFGDDDNFKKFFKFYDESNGKIIKDFNPAEFKHKQSKKNKKSTWSSAIKKGKKKIGKYIY